MAYVRGEILPRHEFHMVAILKTATTAMTTYNGLLTSNGKTNIPNGNNVVFVLTRDGSGSLTWRSDYDFLIDGTTKANLDRVGIFMYQKVGSDLRLYSYNVSEEKFYPTKRTATTNYLDHTTNISNVPPGVVFESSAYNLNPDILYGGVPYKLKYKSGTTACPIYTRLVDVNTGSTLSGNNYYFYTDLNTPASFNAENFDIYLIPGKFDSNLVDGLLHNRITNTGPIHYFAQYITGNMTTTFSRTEPTTNTLQSTSSGAIFTTPMEAHQTYFYNYCSSGFNCGNCMGYCPSNERCLVDTYTKERFLDGDTPLTCDPDRGLDTAEKNLFLSSGLLWGLLGLLLLLLIGFLMYENRYVPSEAKSQSKPQSKPQNKPQNSDISQSKSQTQKKDIPDNTTQTQTKPQRRKLNDRL